MGALGARLALLLSAALWSGAASAQVTAAISNAPIWHTSTSYSVAVPPARWGSRVNSGPGTIGGVYASGSAVYVWEAQNNGTSASGGNGPQTCGTPGTTTFTESTGLIWKCLGIVDYTTFSAWAFDDRSYAALTTYHWHDYVKNAAGLVYRADQVSGVDCTTGASSPPSGTGNGQSDGSPACLWDYAVTVPYWSGSNGPIPKQRYDNGGSAFGPTMKTTQDYTGQFFSGGVSAPKYLANSGGEALMLALQAHQDFTNDTGQSDETTPLGTFFWLAMTCAPIDCPTGSFPLAYDNTQMVSFHNTANVAGAGWSVSIPNVASSMHPNNGFVQEDIFVKFIGIEVKSDHGNGVEGNRPDVSIYIDTIVDANGPTAVYTDAGSVFQNSVFINHSVTSGAFVLNYSYVPVVNNLILYMPNAPTNGTCIAGNNTNNIGEFGPTGTSPRINNTMLFGCPNLLAFYQPYVASYAPGSNQTNNATDSPNSTSSPSFTGGVGISSNAAGATYVGVASPGVSGSACGGPCYSLSFASVFTSTSDLRLKSGSPVIGAGASFSLTPASPYAPISNATDFFGTTRSPTYDPGAAKFVGSSPPPASVVVGSPARLGRRR